MGVRMRRLRSTQRPGLDVMTFIVAFLFLTNPVSSINVMVDYVTHEISEDAMPDDVNVTVSTELNSTVTLRLARVRHIDLDIPLFTLNNDVNGRLIHRREKFASKKATHALYQDVANDAMFQLTKRDAKKDKKNCFKLKGEFTMAGSKYFLHSEKKMKSHFKTTATTTETASTISSSSTPLDDETYRLEAQTSQHQPGNDYREAPTEKIPSARDPKIPEPPREPNLMFEDTKIPNDILSKLKTKTDPHGDIDVATSRSQTRLGSNVSADWPETLSALPRRRRSTGNYFIDVAAFIDYIAYQRFLKQASNDRTTALQNILEYYAFIFNGVDLRYQTISTTYTIHVSVNKVFVMEMAGVSPFLDTNHTETSIDSDTALDAFKYYVAHREGGLLSIYDHVMVFTGYDLTSIHTFANFWQEVSHDTIGISYLSTLCKTDGSSVSVIEDMGGYQCINTAAHELAHSLSARHDGEGNSCSFSKQYIMAASNMATTSMTQYNPWLFSQCSVAYFSSYIQQLMKTSRGQTCLEGRLLIDSNLPDVSDRLLGQIYSPDQQCQLIYGRQSYYCRGLRKSFETICTSMYCLDPNEEDMCYKVSALAGTTCGSGKVCSSGHCIVDRRAPVVDETCMFGEQPGLVYKNMACPALIRSFSGHCYNDIAREKCCESCQTARQPVKNCEYGDPNTGCSSYHCYIWYDISQCCDTCHTGQPIITQKSTAKTTTRHIPRETTAAARATSRATRTSSTTLSSDTILEDCRDRDFCFWQIDATGSQCYDPMFNRHCCKSCQQHYTNKLGCEYGDRRPELCFKSSLCHTNAKWCCQSCNNHASHISRGLFCLVGVLVVTVLGCQQLL